MDKNLLVAYVALGLMAIVPIYFGSFASLKGLRPGPKPPRKPTEDGEYESESSDEEEEGESVSSEDAYMFPIYGSAVLFSLYMVFQYLNKEYVNYLLSGYFALAGVAASTKMLASMVKPVFPFRLSSYHVRVHHCGKELHHLRFTYIHAVMSVVSLVLTAYYLMTKNWIISNLLALAFAVSAIQLIKLDSFKTGIILLGGLFFYDIFWVFGTEVMVSVAKNFDAPIKVVWPKDFLDAVFGVSGVKREFSMLGLGDIVIPGIFVALCLNFDQYSAKARAPASKPVSGYNFAKPYFVVNFIAYIVGLVTTMLVMHIFKAAQPALLYLSPACTLSALVTAVARGELTEVLAYTSDPPTSSSDKKEPLRSKKESGAKEESSGISSAVDTGSNAAHIRSNVTDGDDE